MSAQDQNNNGQDNHNGKAFRLAAIQSPEEEAREQVLRDIAPKVRRKVREDDRLSAPAKFLFNCIFDDCFWHQAGGHGTGQIFADVRTLAERYHHDEKSIRAWRDELVTAGWLWTNYEWPMTEWRITPLMPAPTDNKHKKAVQMALGRASVNHTDTPPNGATGQKSNNSGHSPGWNGFASQRAREGSPPTEGNNTGARGNLYPDNAGQVPTGDGIGSHNPRPTFPRATGQVPTGDGTGSHNQEEPKPRSSASASSRRVPKGFGEKTPRSLEQGDLRGEGIPPHENDLETQIRLWKTSLNGSFPSRLEKMLSKFTAQLGAARQARSGAELLRRKIAILREALEGPMPAWAPPKPSVPIVDDIAKRQPTQEEIESAREFEAERAARKAAK